MPGVRETRLSLVSGAVSAADHTAATLAAIAAADPRLHAFVAVAGPEAMRAAEAADRLIRERGRAAWSGRPLLGIPIAVKDLIQTADLPTRRGSRLPNHRPRADAPAVARLRAAGANVVGKTSTSEYGWSASTAGPLGPATRNPWAPERTAGGSSGGSAAAVAAGLCAAALGTDGAGSVRIPAAFCGVTGFKPTYGRVPYVPAPVERLAHLGTLTASVSDAAELVGVLEGPHRADPDSAAVPRTGPVGRPLRIAWVEFPGTVPPVREASERILPALAARGHRVERIDVPFPDPYRALVDVVSAYEAAGTAPADEDRADPGRLVLVRHGRTLGADALARAEEVRYDLRRRLAAVHERVDLLAMAAVPVEPFAAEQVAPPGYTASDLSWLAWSPATYPFNLTGAPALCLPTGRTPAGLPVGVQLAGAPGADELVLAVGRDAETDLGPLRPDPTPERMA